MDDRTGTHTTLTDARFDSLAGACAVAAAVLALVYSVAFVVLAQPLLYSTALLAGSLLSTVAVFAIYERIRGAGSVARVGIVLGLAGLLGAAVHGAFDLAVAIHPEEAGLSGGPFPVDPRGFLTFGVTGLGVLLLSWAGLRVEGLPRGLLYLGLVFGVLLVVVYLARLIVLTATNPLVAGPAALAGLILGPVWYAWIGWLLLARRA